MQASNLSKSIPHHFSLNWQAKIISYLRQKFQCLILATTTSKDKELQIIMNEVGLNFSVNSRSWKRNSALLVYSRYYANK